MKTSALLALAIAAVLGISLSNATAQNSEEAAAPQADQLAVPEGPGNCGNVRACVYSNKDFNGTQSDWGVPGSAGTGGTSWTYTGQFIRSAKNNFNNRKVVLSTSSSGNNKYCIPAGQNRGGPFNPARTWIRIGANPSSCN